MKIYSVYVDSELWESNFSQSDAERIAELILEYLRTENPNRVKIVKEKGE